jgi:hypothetical protein
MFLHASPARSATPTRDRSRSPVVADRPPPVGRLLSPNPFPCYALVGVGTVIPVAPTDWSPRLRAIALPACAHDVLNHHVPPRAAVGSLRTAATYASLRRRDTEAKPLDAKASSAHLAAPTGVAAQQAVH